MGRPPGGQNRPHTPDPSVLQHTSAGPPGVRGTRGPLTEAQRASWLAEAQRRAKASRRRRTLGYKQQRKQQRKKLAERRAAETAKGGHSYKGDAGGGKGIAIGGTAK